MKWIKKLWGFTGAIPKCSSPCYTVANKQQNGFVHGERIPMYKQAVLDNQHLALGETLDLARCLTWNPHQIYGSRTNFCQSKHYSLAISHQFKHGIHTGPNLSRDFLVKLWVADWEMKKVIEKRERKIVKHAKSDETVFSIKSLSERFFSGSSVTEERPCESKDSVIEHVKAASSEEALIASLLSRPNLLITRDIEWANLTLGFEQENRYAIVDVLNPHEPAGFIREQSNVIFRQLLRTRRPFVASITDGYGNELFRVRRPFWWITSSIYAEVGGKEIGVVHRRWHLWRRIYDLYLGNEQFAVVENPGLWNWTFTLKGINGEVLAEIDRDWRGFGFEIFTDAGQYVIRFGNAAHNPTSGPATNVQELEVARPLTLSECAITVALAVSLDNDYFSRHGGWNDYEHMKSRSIGARDDDERKNNDEHRKSRSKIRFFMS